MRRLVWDEPGFNVELERLCQRPGYPPEIEADVSRIVADVRENGDDALSRYALQFDRVKLQPADFLVTPAEVTAAVAALDPKVKCAIRKSLRAVKSFARCQRPHNWRYSPRSGVTLGEKFEPLNRVGIYIPGGTAPLASTVVHTAGIASAAGVNEIVATTPPDANGNINPAVLYAMLKSGVTEIYRLGGVYSIAAMAYGTSTIRRVDKIVGPGNAYVTAAKKLVYGQVAIDMVAGPSEIMIIADDTADARFIAADLLSQAEHGSGLEQAVLVTTAAELVGRVEHEMLRQRASLPRLATVNRVLERGVFLILVKDLEQAVEIAGQYAPEHLEVLTRSPLKVGRAVKAAGAIFLGQWTPEPIGDFCAGPSHVLPTAGSARYFRGLSMDGFFRRTSIVQYSKAALSRELEVVETFAAIEGLAAHGRAGAIRCRNLKEDGAGAGEAR